MKPAQIEMREEAKKKPRCRRTWLVGTPDLVPLIGNPDEKQSENINRANDHFRDFAVPLASRRAPVNFLI
jgi:hypothetical protein